MQISHVTVKLSNVAKYISDLDITLALSDKLICGQNYYYLTTLLYFNKFCDNIITRWFIISLQLVKNSLVDVNTLILLNWNP